MGIYIGSKIIEATPMSRNEFLKFIGSSMIENDDEPGYRVVYPDGYSSWSPKETFEIAYREVTSGEKKFISDEWVEKNM